LLQAHPRLERQVGSRKTVDLGYHRSLLVCLEKVISRHSNRCWILQKYSSFEPSYNTYFHLFLVFSIGSLNHALEFCICCPSSLIKESLLDFSPLICLSGVWFRFQKYSPTCKCRKLEILFAVLAGLCRTWRVSSANFDRPKAQCIRKGNGLPFVWSRSMQGSLCPRTLTDEFLRRLGTYPDVVAEIEQVRVWPEPHVCIFSWRVLNWSAHRALDSAKWILWNQKSLDGIKYAIKSLFLMSTIPWFFCVSNVFLLLKFIIL
jgi:hypothetical protein